MWFMAACRDCDTEIPFGEEAERKKWIAEHSLTDHTLTSGNKTPTIVTREEGN